MEHKHIIKHMERVLEMDERRRPRWREIANKTIDEFYQRILGTITPEEIEKINKTKEILGDYEKLKKLIKNLKECDINIWHQDIQEEMTYDKNVNCEEISLEINSVYIDCRLYIKRENWKIVSIRYSSFYLNREIYKRRI